ncbi:Neuroligin-4, X-linked [Armadillidium nasatum]|uniref:Neuroligin-4, X-linked n=1 Tax=Armadillidium nasatum TaxID=96803 RepID=A0A5N5SZP6_9CRUS|nr:Neuroligin-4, X-linked [Armadillidium nasatum]
MKYGFVDPNQKLPVLVYIHGESYEWNSGNPYDGTVLSSYGKVVVVTVNFRLGILGFLRPALNEKYVSNFGLLDQIAALHWIRGNIVQFGGDPESVTIFGHGTGAALVNLLLVSPVAQSSKGKWLNLLRVAKTLKCPLIDRGDELVNCLRMKTVEELLAVPLETAPFTTPLGPIMDGTVIKQDPLRLILSIDTASLSKYDLLYGATSAESFNILNASEVKFGMSKERRNRLLRAYISNTFDHQTSVIYAAVDNEYTTWNSSGRSPTGKRKEMENQGTVHGEELAYVFGAPLVKGFSHFGLNYTLEEQFLSELVMILWTNFAKTGNPNLPTPQKYKTEGAPFNWMENLRTLWPPYDQMNQQYLHIEQKKLAVWNRLIPDLISSSTLGAPIHPPRATVSTINLVPTVQPDYKPLLTPPPHVSPYKPVPVPQAPYSPSPYPSKHTKSQHDWKDPYDTSDKLIEPETSTPAPPPPTYAGTPMSIVILIGIMILFLNCFAMAGIYYKRDKIRFSRSRSNRELNTSNEEAPEGSNVETSGEKVSSSSSSLKGKDAKATELKNIKSFKPESGIYSGDEVLVDSSHCPLSSSESSLKRKELSSSSSFSTYPFSREGKKNFSKDQKTLKDSKSSLYDRKRNKSENSIYSEVSDQNSPDILDKKSPSVKFLNGVSLSSKSLNKSSTSINSVKSTGSKVSVKSNASKSSSKCVSLAKPVKKNASCQSLPTPEYCWGITPEMTMTGNELRNTHEKSEYSRQNVTAAMQKKKYPKVLPDVPYVLETHASTLPKARPPPPLRSTSLTSNEIEELENIHVIYRKKRNSRGESNSCDTDAIEQFYGTGGGEAPASPIRFYNTNVASTDAKKRLRRRSSEFEYEQNETYSHYPIYDTYVHKEKSSVQSVPPLPEPMLLKNYPTYSDSRSPRGPFGTFGKSSMNKKNYEDNKPLIPKATDNSANTSSSSDTHSPQSGLSKSGIIGISSHLPMKQYPTQEIVGSKSTSGSQSSSHTIYDTKENTGTVKKKKSSPAKYPSLSDSDKNTTKQDRPLKSVLKTTSAYDKPKPSASASSLSSSASINLTPVSTSDKSVPETQSQGKNLGSSFKIITPSSKVKSDQNK